MKNTYAFTMRNTFGYILGFLVFVAGIPALMWWVSGRPFPWAPTRLWTIAAILLMTPGLALSIWSIIHMKKVGEGNPFDAYNHELAPRTNGGDSPAHAAGPFRGKAPGERLWRGLSGV